MFTGLRGRELQGIILPALIKRRFSQRCIAESRDSASTCHIDQFRCVYSGWGAVDVYKITVTAGAAGTG